MTTAEKLAQFITQYDPASLTPLLGRAVRRCLLDLIGAACAGYGTEAARASRAVAGRLFPRGKASVWFSETKLSAVAAAFCNATAAAALDLDDGHRSAAGHPGAGIIPACLAMAEGENIPSEILFTAIVLGYEVGCRIAASRDLSYLPTMATGRWIAVGVAASNAYLLRLSPEVTAQALAIAGIHSPDMAAAGYSRMMGNQVKEGIPWAVLTGMTAVHLAAEGLTGPLDIFDHPDYYDASRILEKLGDHWAIGEIYFKPYGCCRWIHAAIDALLSILSDNDLPTDAIDQIQVETFRRAVEGLSNEPRPATVEAAQYSLPFSLAVAAILGREGLLPLREEWLGRRDLLQLSEKVRLNVDPELDRLFPSRSPARVVVTCGNRRYEQTVLDPLGDPDNPLSDEDLREKFYILTKDLLAEDRRKAILESIELDQPGNLSNLFHHLSRTL